MATASDAPAVVLGTFEVMEQLPALQVVVPMIAAVLCAIVRNGAVSAAITIAACLSMPVISFLLLHEVLIHGTISYALGGWEPPVGIEYRVDLPNAYMLVLVSLMAALIALYAPRSIASEIPPERRGWYYAMFLMCLCGLQGMVISGDAFNIFVFMEVSSLSTYAMIALGTERRALVAAFQYLIIGTIGATFYVIGVGFLFWMTGTLNLVDIAGRLHEVENIRPVIAGAAFLFVGIGLKLAMFPLHLWLPNAYAYAPSVATAFVASTATKVAIYLLIRFLYSVFGAEDMFSETPAQPLLLTLAVMAMILTSMTAVFEVNVKRMLAYSSVAQVGYMLLGIALISQTGIAGGIAHMMNHAIIKGCLFLAVGCVVFSTGATLIRDMEGIGRTMPVTMTAFVIAGLGLIGVPGTAGFTSKWLLIQGAAEQQMWVLVVAIVASSVLAVFYVGRVIEIAWFRAPAAPVVRKPPIEMIVVTWILALVTLWFGIETSLPIGIAEQAATVLLEGYVPSVGIAQ